MDIGLLAGIWVLAALMGVALAVAAHELAHYLVARSLGLNAHIQAGPAAMLLLLDPRPPGGTGPKWESLPHVRVVANGGPQRACPAKALRWVRHAGWLASTALAAAAYAVHAMCAAAALPPAAAASLQAAAAAFVLVALCSLPTDLAGIGSVHTCQGGRSQCCSFFCGNFGLLLASVTGAKEAGVEPTEVLGRQCSISMMRGAQSGGLMTLISNGRDVDGVRVRVAPRKRQSLAVLLSRRFRLTAGHASHAGDHGVFVGHTRFATSSIPLPSESHPHQWTPTAPVVIWRADDYVPDGVSRCVEHCGVYITHNGDYDLARDWVGRYRTHQEAADFLTGVLGSPPPAKCDSICIAGMMELHRTQGMWAASLRLALVEVAGVPFERICRAAEGAGGGTWASGSGDPAGEGDVEEGQARGPVVASAAELAMLGDALDRAFAGFLAAKRCRGSEKPSLGRPNGEANGSVQLSDQLPTPFKCDYDSDTLMATPRLVEDDEREALRKPVAPGAEATRLLAAMGGASGAAELGGMLAEALAAALNTGGTARGGSSKRQQPLPAWLGSASLAQVVAAAVDNFIHASLYTALVRVTRSAKDSFGVAATCTLDPDRICLAAWNQPMSIALCPQLGAALYSSETQSVMLNLLRAGAGASSSSSPIAGSSSSTGASSGSGNNSGTTAVQPNGWRPGHCTHRIDMDEGGGEVMELVLKAGGSGGSMGAGADGWAVVPEHPNGGFLRLRVYSVRDDSEVAGAAAFVAAGRIVSLVGNNYVSFSAINLKPGLDLVAADLADVPRVLRAIAADWADPSSLNRHSAAAFAAALRSIAEARCATTKRAGDDDASGQDIDVLLVGVEVSLWLAEQFAADLKTLFPGLRVAAISANKVIGVLGSNRGSVPSTGFPFCRTSARLEGAIALACSHSGQTFPTIHATRLLQAMMPGRVFVMSGSVDTKMALVLGQRLTPDAPFCERCFDTKAGWRSAEPASLSVVAMAHTMTELLLYTGATLCGGDGVGPGAGARATPAHPPFGLALSAEELLDLRIARDAFVQDASPALTGADAAGAPAPSRHHDALVTAGRRWALHVLEGPWAWALAATYITVTVISGYPLARTVMDAITSAAAASTAAAGALARVALVLDAAIYIWCGILAAMALRLVQRRPLLARWGKRSVVVADVPYVNQCMEAFISKMFALSYGIASVDVHGANPTDHLVHKFTHRVVRGLLIAVGRPDGRLYSQTQTESWILLGLLQAKVIASLGAQPEVLTLGHNPFKNEYIDAHVVLPTTRPKGLTELLQITDDSKGANPNAIFAARCHTLATTMLSGSVAAALQRHRSAALITEGASPATPAAAAGVAADTEAYQCSLARSPRPTDLTDTPLGGFSSREPSAHGGGQYWHGSTPPGGPSHALLTYGSEGHVLGEHVLAAAGGRKGTPPSRATPRDVELAGLPPGASNSPGTGASTPTAAGDAPSGALAGRMVQMLEEQGVIEALLESRFLSLERLIAFFVLFHAMAARVAGAWPLLFDVSRSQSGLRIATTASPVLASDIDRTLEEVAAERARRGAAMHGSRAWLGS